MTFLDHFAFSFIPATSSINSLSCEGVFLHRMGLDHLLIFTAYIRQQVKITNLPPCSIFNPNSSGLLTVGKMMDIVSANAMLTVLPNPGYLCMTKLLRIWRYMSTYCA